MTEDEEDEKLRCERERLGDLHMQRRQLTLRLVEIDTELDKRMGSILRLYHRIVERNKSARSQDIIGPEVEATLERHEALMVSHEGLAIPPGPVYEFPGERELNKALREESPWTV